MMEIQTEKQLTTQQASKYLIEKGIKAKPGSMQVWRCLGKGPRYRRVGGPHRGMIYYTKQDLDKFAAGEAVETIDSYRAEVA